MKKLLFILYLTLCMSFAHNAYAKPKYLISITSEKDTYDLLDTAQFNIEIKHGKHHKHLHSIDVEATFPNDDSNVTITESGRGKLSFSPVLEQELEAQTLKVKIYRKNRLKHINKLEKQKIKLKNLIDKLETSFWKSKHKKHSLENYKKLLKNADKIIEKLNVPIATASKTINVIIDKEPPVITISGVEEAGLYNVNITPIIDIQDEHEFTSTILLNGSPFTSGAIISADGKYNLTVEAKDKFTNSSSESVSFEIDKTPPVINVDSPTDGSIINSDKVDIAGTVSSDTALLKVNGVETQVNGSSFSIQGFVLQKGINTITFDAIDNAGNHSSLNVSVEAMFDYDDDGLSEAEEEEYGTDPNKSDTDGDSLSDGDEVKKHGTDPTKWDTDNDRITDKDELFVYKTNPNNPDTDGDKLNDGLEIFTFISDPFDIDSDNDGLSDGDEVFVYMSNPVNPDTDGDTLPDGIEIGIYNSSPISTDTDGDGLKDSEEALVYLTYAYHPDSDGDMASDYEEVMAGTNPLDSSSFPQNYITTITPINLKVTPTATTALIEFSTFEEMTALIQYGTSATYTKHVIEDFPGTQHQITLSKLKPNKSYYFSVFLESDNTVPVVVRGPQFKTLTDVEDTIPPEISIVYPQHGDTVISNKIIVRGTVDEYHTNVEVNGRQAIIKDKDFYVLNLPIEPGENVLNIKATDASGNLSTDFITVFFVENPVTRISTNIPDDPNFTSLPERFSGAWGGEPPIIKINGKPTAVLIGGSWIGPKNISRETAEEENISDYDENYLIIEPGITEIKVSVSSGGTPITFEEYTNMGGGGSEGADYEIFKLLKPGGVKKAKMSFFAIQSYTSAPGHARASYFDKITNNIKCTYTRDTVTGKFRLNPPDATMFGDTPTLTMWNYKYKMLFTYYNPLDEKIWGHDSIKTSYFEVEPPIIDPNMLISSDQVKLNWQVTLDITCYGNHFNYLLDPRTLVPNMSNFSINDMPIKDISEYNGENEPGPQKYFKGQINIPYTSDSYFLNLTKWQEAPEAYSDLAEDPDLYREYTEPTYGFHAGDPKQSLVFCDISYDIDGRNGIDKSDQLAEEMDPGLILGVGDKKYLSFLSSLEEGGSLIIERPNKIINVGTGFGYINSLLKLFQVSKESEDFQKLQSGLFIECVNGGKSQLNIIYIPPDCSSSDIIGTVKDTINCTVCKVDNIILSSNVSDNSPVEFTGHCEWPFDSTIYPNPGKHLVIFYKDVVDDKFQVKNFDVDIKASIFPKNITEDKMNESWTLKKEPSSPKSGNLNKNTTYDVKFQNPKEGGVYKFIFKLTDGSIKSEANLVLPLACPEVKDIIRKDLIRADNFAAKVNKKYFFQEQKLPHLWDWFHDYGHGDYLYRPHNVAAPTVILYNQMNPTTGMGPVATWFGRSIRIGKMSNFMFAYGATKIGYTLNQILFGGELAALREGHIEEDSAKLSYVMGYLVANDPRIYDTSLKFHINDLWEIDSDDKHKKLWPNNIPATGGMTSPGFLDIKDP